MTTATVLSQSFSLTMSQQQAPFQVPPQTNTFPVMLFQILNRAEAQLYAHIVSWRGHGKAFRIDDKEKFVNSILPMYCRLTQFASFQRQLHSYGFQKITRRGPDYGCYYHLDFLRDRPDLINRIQRCKVTTEKVASKPKQKKPDSALSHHDNLVSTYTPSADANRSRIIQQGGLVSLSEAYSYSPQLQLVDQGHPFPPTSNGQTQGASFLSFRHDTGSIFSSEQLLSEAFFPSQARPNAFSPTTELASPQERSLKTSFDNSLPPVENLDTNHSETSFKELVRETHESIARREALPFDVAQVFSAQQESNRNYVPSHEYYGPDYSSALFEDF